MLDSNTGRECKPFDVFTLDGVMCMYDARQEGYIDLIGLLKSTGSSSGIMEKYPTNTTGATQCEVLFNLGELLKRVEKEICNQ